MESKYPSPRLKCKRRYCAEGVSGVQYKTCARYYDWIAFWWKEFKRQFKSATAPLCTSKKQIYISPSGRI